MSSPRPLVAALWGLALALLCFALGAAHVDVPHWDEWIYYADLMRILESGPQFSDLIVQHNEHRLLFTRIAGLLLLLPLSFSAWAAVSLNVLMGIATALLVRALMRRTGAGRTGFAGALVALLAFSTAQWQTYGWGFANQILVPPLCALVALHLLRKYERGAVATVAAGALCIFAAFSFGSGLFLWFALLPVVVVRNCGARHPALLPVVWLMAAAVTFMLYFHGYQSPPHHSTPSLQDALPIIGYVFAFLGSPFAPDRLLLPLAMTAAVAGTGFMAFLVFRLAGIERDRRKDLAPWFALAVLALISALATAASRSGFGIEHALQSRYVTTANLFWFALIGLVHSAPSAIAPIPRLVRRTITCSMIALLLFSTVTGAVIMTDRADAFRTARQELFTLEDVGALERIFPDPATLMRMLPVFFEHRLGPYADIPTDQELETLTSAAESGSFMAATPVAQGPGGVPGVRISGTAPKHDGGQAWILVHEGERLVFATKPDSEGNFSAFLPASFLGTAAPVLRAWLALGETVLPLATMSGIPVEMPRATWPSPTVSGHFFGPGVDHWLALPGSGQQE